MDRCKRLMLVKAETSGEPENRPGYQEGSVHFVEFQPGKGLVNVDTKPRTTRTHILQKSKYKNRQHFQVIRNRQLRASSSTTGSHARLVRYQELDKFLEHIISTILQLVGQRPFHSLISEESGDSNLISRCKHLREVSGCWQGQSDDTNTSFTYFRHKCHLYEEEEKTYRNM